MTMSFGNRVAIVTGAGRGLGRAHAIALAARGARVLVNDLGSQVDGSGADTEPAQNVVDEIVAMGGTAAVSIDSVTTPEGASRIVGAAIDLFGGVDILVNNAGILTTTSFPETPQEDFDRHLSVHLRGAFNMCKAAWPNMVENGYGRVINTTSTSFFGMIPVISYASAKAGLIGLTRSLATIGSSHGIKANLIAPHANTRMSGRTKHPAKAPAENDRTTAPREPELVSPLVVVLADEACPVTGEMFGVGMGRVARIFIAETRGYVNVDLTPEDVMANWDTVMSEGDFSVPESYSEYSARFRDIAASDGDA